MAILVNHFHLLTILLSTQVLLCLCSSNSKNDPRCNKPFRCGRINNLSYPFRHPGLPVHCGEPGFEITCDDSNTPIITINSQSYRVLALSVSLQSLTVVPINIEGNMFCLQEPVNLSPFHLAWNAQNITLYLRCSQNANNSLWLADHQLNCYMNNGTLTVGYYVVSSDKVSNEVYDALRSCRDGFLVPAFASTIQALETKPSSENLNVILSNGFGLTWEGNASISGVEGPSRVRNVFGSDESGSDRKFMVEQRSSDGSVSRFKLMIGLGVAGVAILAIITAMLVTFKLKKQLLLKGVLLKKLRGGKSKDWKMIEDFISQYGSELAPKRYSYSDIKRITKSFKEELGQGGFGMVYKGQLPDSRLVAVKVLNESKARGEDFINEVASISRTSHVNIVAFLGFCFEGSTRALIYEFMPNGSLDQFICHPNSPDKSHDLEVKTTLYEFALGIARGLEYLHQGCSTRILHFDIKPHNILLDENFCPKISDFGLAKLCERKESILSTMSARGTIGYIAPEVFYRSFGRVSHKSDVYSYGMMILEIVGLKRDMHNPNSDTIFPIWIYELIKNGTDLDVQGMRVEDEELNRKMIIVSLWCIQSNPSDRPSMTKVLEMLQGSIESLVIPPTPFLFSPPVLPEISSFSTLLVTESDYTENNSDSV